MAGRWFKVGAAFAATGPEYPLRFDVTGDTGGRRDFSGYGAALHIAVPSGATDISHG